MTLGEMVFWGFCLGAGAMLTAVTFGPMYFFFKVLPDIERALRKAHFVETRREKRKQRAARRREQEQFAQTLIQTIQTSRGA